MASSRVEPVLLTVSVTVPSPSSASVDAAEKANTGASASSPMVPTAVAAPRLKWLVLVSVRVKWWSPS